MIKFENISLNFADQLLLDDISFTLHRNERCGLIGRNGSGKSTLLKLILKEIDQCDGSISMPKDYKIGHLEQHIKFTKPSILEEACLGLPPEEKDHEYKAKKILFGLGFTDDNINAIPSSLSGGYHLRLHLAKVLISNPDCLLLDEPTNYLDIISIKWLKRFLSKWPGEFILISHDRDFLDSVTTHTMGIHRNKLLKIKGSTKAYLNQLYSQEEIYEKTRIKQEKQRQHVQEYITRFKAKASKAAQAKSKQKVLDKTQSLDKLADINNLSFSFRENAFSGKNMLLSKNINFSYSKEPLIENFSCEINKGERIALVGKNGYGKSTILKILTGEIKPSSGTLRVRDNTEIGYFGQTNINNLNENSSIEEEISTANHRLKYSEVRQIAGTMMFTQDQAKKKIAILSGGEKSRVLLGKIIAKPCNLLFLDEPTHHLDIESIEALLNALKKFSGTVVIVTHSELILKNINFDKIIFCEKSKQTLFHGSYKEFTENNTLEENLTTSKKKSNKQLLSKQERALLVNNRSKVLSPIKKEIASLEKEIISLEKNQKTQLSDLEKDPSSPSLIKQMGEDQKQIDFLYSSLDKLYIKYDLEKSRFNT